jgi:hypothetical protein
VQAQRDPAMQGVCEALLQGWSAAGGDLFMWYHVGVQPMVGSFDPFGVAERMNDENAPKLRCLKAIAAEALPPRQARHVLPQSFPATEATSPNTSGLLVGGQEMDHVIHSPSAACFQLSVQALVLASGPGVATAGLQALIDGQPQGNSDSHTLPDGVSSEAKTLALGQVCVPAGLHALTLKAPPGSTATLRLQQVDWVLVPQ